MQQTLTESVITPDIFNTDTAAPKLSSCTRPQGAMVDAAPTLVEEVSAPEPSVEAEAAAPEQSKSAKRRAKKKAAAENAAANDGAGAEGAEVPQPGTPPEEEEGAGAADSDEEPETPSVGDVVTKKKKKKSELSELGGNESGCCTGDWSHACGLPCIQRGKPAHVVYLDDSPPSFQTRRRRPGLVRGPALGKEPQRPLSRPTLPPFPSACSSPAASTPRENGNLTRRSEFALEVGTRCLYHRF